MFAASHPRRSKVHYFFSVGISTVPSMLQYIKDFLHFHDELPVRLSHLITEVFLQGVYGFSAYLERKNNGTITY